MEHRDNDELTSAAESLEDTAMQQLLARYRHPAAIAPPPDLTARVLARLPSAPPAAAADAAFSNRRRRRWLAGFCLALLVVMVSLGFWGVLGDSSGPAQLLGGSTAGLGRVVLILILTAKPLVYTLIAPGAPVLLLPTLSAIIVAWGCLQLARQIPIQEHPSSTEYT